MVWFSVLVHVSHTAVLLNIIFDVPSTRVINVVVFFEHLCALSCEDYKPRFLPVVLWLSLNSTEDRGTEDSERDEAPVTAVQPERTTGSAWRSDVSHNSQLLCSNLQMECYAFNMGHWTHDTITGYRVKFKRPLLLGNWQNTAVNSKLANNWGLVFSYLESIRKKYFMRNVFLTCSSPTLRNVKMLLYNL